MEPLANPALFSIPLLGHGWLRQTAVDPQVWAQAVCAATPVRICEPQQAGLPFRNDSAVLNLGQVVVVATQGSAITLVTEQHPFAQMLIPYRGWGLWTLENAGYENPFGESVLYLPPAPLSLQNDTTSGVALNQDPATLVATALTMAGPEGLLPHRLSVFQQPKRLLMGDPGCAPLIHGLYSLLSTLNQLTASPGTDVALLRFDDVLIRMVVLLLLPELQHNPPGTKARETKAEAQGKLLPVPCHLHGSFAASMAAPLPRFCGTTLTLASGGTSDGSSPCPAGHDPRCPSRRPRGDGRRPGRTRHGPAGGG